ncbi:MAG: acyloxyacyl hydrolase [Deltaproteobacteria bacterium]|nr:acyloxyacyl hydrolase [Deltaproteobacteria bacterium]
MKLWGKIFFHICIAAALNISGPAMGADRSHFNPGASIQSEIFTQNRISLQVISGALCSPVGIGPDNPNFDYWQTNLRLGWMLHDPYQTSFFLRGNFEAILEVTNSLIYEGFGNYIGGISGLIRYNFLPPDSKFVAYAQGGAGVAYTDAYKDYSQRAIGQAVEFTPQVGLGFHYLISKNWSIDGEAMFHHISNAGLAERNVGTNALGAFVGVTCYFDSLFPSKLFIGEGEENLPHEKTRAPKGAGDNVVSRGATGPGDEASSIKAEDRPPRTKPLEFLQFAVEGEGELRVVAPADAPFKKYKAFLLKRHAGLAIDLPGRWRGPKQSALKVKTYVKKRPGTNGNTFRVVTELAGKEPRSGRVRESTKGRPMAYGKRASLTNRVKIAPIRLLAKRSQGLILAAGKSYPPMDDM